MLGLALAGAGFIGPVHAANIAAHPDGRRAWIVDPDVAAATTPAQRCGARASDALERRQATRAAYAAMMSSNCGS